MPKLALLLALALPMPAKVTLTSVGAGVAIGVNVLNAGTTIRKLRAVSRATKRIAIQSAKKVAGK